MENKEIIKGYKGFNPDLTCKDFKYEVGKDSKAKGALGCRIVLTEREDWNGECYPIKEVKAFRVDDETIKPDTYYKLVNGEAIEVE